jgi:hypothetical protein
MRFQERDEQILKAIYDYGGVLARRQLKELFWPEKSLRAMEIRLSKLQKAGYINWPNNDQRKLNPIPEPIVWLASKGILFLAQKGGIETASPKHLSENQLRLLEKNLSKQGIHWVREPAWSKLKHDLTIVDLRRSFEKGAQSLSATRLEEWIGEYAFRAEPDVVHYQVKGKGQNKYQKKRAVIPDGYFSLIDLRRQAEGKPYKARFLIEVDMATHSNPNFGRFKAVPYSAYIGSQPFVERFGGRSARWLVITTSAERRRNLMHECFTHAGSKALHFYFTLISEAVKANPLNDPIWFQVGSKEPRTLLGFTEAGNENSE